MLPVPYPKRGDPAGRERGAGGGAGGAEHSPGRPWRGRRAGRRRQLGPPLGRPPCPLRGALTSGEGSPRRTRVRSRLPAALSRGSGRSRRPRPPGQAPPRRPGNVFALSGRWATSASNPGLCRGRIKGSRGVGGREAGCTGNPGSEGKRRGEACRAAASVGPQTSWRSPGQHRPCPSCLLGRGRSPPRTWSPVMAAHSPPPGWRLALDINSSPLAPGSRVRRGRILRYCLPGLVFGQMRSLGRWQLPPEWPGHLRVFSTCGPRTSFPFSVRGVSGRGCGSQSLQGRAEGPSLAFCSVKSGATFKSSF